MSAMAYTGVGKADFTYNINGTFAAFAEAGYRYLQTSSLTPSDNENGSQIFKNPATQQYIPVSISLSGPFAAVGVSATF